VQVKINLTFFSQTRPRYDGNRRPSTAHPSTRASLSYYMYVTYVDVFFILCLHT